MRELQDIDKKLDQLQNDFNALSGEVSDALAEAGLNPREMKHRTRDNMALITSSFSNAVLLIEKKAIDEANAKAQAEADAAATPED